jgi:D-glycero-D-manno-heptose 1,7-bisphosphate phosphatase
MKKKIKSEREIIKIVKKLKKEKKKIVATSGSFDLLHFGHIAALSEAKKKGDVLIVLLNSDSSVKLYKGKDRPIFPEDIRAKVLSALEPVDYVTIFNEITPVKILEKIQPDIYCQGEEWGKNCIERTIVEKYGGKIHVIKAQKNFSTTKILEKIKNIISKPSNKAIFLDRDGVINANEPEYVHKIKDFKFVRGAIPALKKLSKTDYKIIIITNQSGIGRGYYTIKDFKKLNSWMLKKLKKEGIRIDKVYFCPHKPEDNCNCRKPKPGLILKALEDFDINLSKSWLIGDDVKDVILGRSMNIKTIKIGKKMPKELKLEPNYYAKNLLEAVNIILKSKA